MVNNMGKIIHGHSLQNNKTSTYQIWKSMIKRCSNSNDRYYANYGGRGIKVCHRWKKFENFLKDMGEKPNGMTLDRIDNNGHYCMENCRWATRKQQMRNTRRNRLITINNKTKCLSEWCEELCLNYHRTKKRLNRGWPVEEAFDIVPHKVLCHKYFTWHNQTLNMRQWCKVLNLKYTTVMMRIKSGWSIPRALGLL